MLLKRSLAVTVVVLVSIGATTTHADTFSSIPSYYDHLQYNLTAPSTYARAVGGYANPAVYGMLPGGELQFAWTDSDRRFKSLKEWGLFMGGDHVGFGVVRNRIPLSNGEEARVNDLRIGITGGNRNATWGLGYGWSTGGHELVNGSDIFQAGFVHRYGRYVSLGLAGTFAIENSNQSGLFDVAVRPLGSGLITVFADAELPKGVSVSHAPWSVGARVEPIEGLQLVGRYFENETYAISVGVNLAAGLKLSATPHYNKDSHNTNTTYEVRVGFPERSFFRDHLYRDRTYLAMNLKGTVKYRGFKYFDAESHPLFRVLQDLEHAKNDPMVSGVALNLSGARYSRGKAWELREALQEVRDADKGVVIFLDEVGMTELHLASVADRIVLDPESIVVLPGYVLGRTFVRDMLDKIGVGFDEWRFLTYKSAAEAFSRTTMSDPDKEQRYGLIEDLYATVREDVSTSRGVNANTFDQWINDELLLNAHEAKRLGMVDVLGRWEDVKDVIEELEGGKRRYVPRQLLAGNWFRSELWGEDPEIAIVYALGFCAMDTGINARRLEKVFQRLRDDRGVKAVVFRVDSPGGYGQAADVVAQALRKCAEKKPVIVTQGDIATSGGYWLSLYGTEVYALPMTISGSIGVIGGWYWDEGIGEKLGHTSDHVQVGKYGDIGFGIRLLLAGPMLPERALTEEEREKVLDEMNTFYHMFLEKVAAGRGITVEQADEVGQGRVFSGIDGVSVGIVDKIGGLRAAIDAAREAAGIAENEVVTYVEYPKLPPFNLGGLRRMGPFQALLGKTGFGGLDADEGGYGASPEWTYLRAVMDRPGRPLYMLPPELYIMESSFGY